MLKVKIFTLYPDLFPGPLNSGLYKKAQENKIWQLEIIDINKFALDKHATVDDTPFGGGSGMVRRADVLANAIDKNVNLNKKLKEAKNDVPGDMINVGKEENFEIKLREVRREEDSTYETDLGILGRGVGLLSNHHSPYNESMPYKIIDECFLQRPDRAWTAEEDTI